MTDTGDDVYKDIEQSRLTNCGRTEVNEWGSVC